MCWHLTFVSSFSSGGEGMRWARCVRALHCWAAASGDWLMVSLLGKRCEDMVGGESKHGCELEGDVLLQATPAVLAGVPSEITWLGEAAPAVPAAGGIAGGTAQGSGRALWARAGTIDTCWSFCFVCGREGEADEISQAPIQFRLPLKWLLMFWQNKVCLYVCCMEKRSGVCHQRLDKPCAALPAIPLVSREDSRMQISLGGRDHSIWHFKICCIMLSNWRLCTCQQLNMYLVGPAQRVLLENSLPLQQRLP